MHPLAYLAEWARARRGNPFRYVDRSVMSDIDRQRYRRWMRAQGIEPGDLFRVH